MSRSVFFIFESEYGLKIVSPSLELTVLTQIVDLIGMKEDTFHSLSFLDQILSADFLSKVSKLFWRWKLTSIGLTWHPAKLINSYKKWP